MIRTQIWFIVGVLSFSRLSNSGICRGLLTEEVQVGNVTIELAKIGDYITFTLYTRALGDNPIILTRENWSETKENLMFDKEFKFITHGWISDGHSNGSVLIRNSYLNDRDVNVITVDWHQLADDPYYIISAALTCYVGLSFGNFIDFMVENGVSLRLIHLMGHSIGAHVVAFAAQAAESGKVGRVTGIDPALPGFTLEHTRNQISNCGAKFVDVIHTAGGLPGFFNSLGHVDFYPNGGRVPQPACLTTNISKIHVGCSHMIALKYFAESINSTHKFVSQKCRNWKEYQLNKGCTQEFERMGDHVSLKARGNFYLRTNAEYPYAKN